MGLVELFDVPERGHGFTLTLAARRRGYFQPQPRIGDQLDHERDDLQHDSARNLPADHFGEQQPSTPYHLRHSGGDVVLHRWRVPRIDFQRQGWNLGKGSRLLRRVDQ